MFQISTRGQSHVVLEDGQEVYRAATYRECLKHVRSLEQKEAEGSYPEATASLEELLRTEGATV